MTCEEINSRNESIVVDWYWTIEQLLHSIAPHNRAIVCHFQFALGGNALLQFLEYYIRTI